MRCFRISYFKGKKKTIEPRPSNEIMVPFRLFFENFRQAPPSFLYESPSSPGKSFGTPLYKFDGLPVSFEEVLPLVGGGTVGR